MLPNPNLTLTQTLTLTLTSSLRSATYSIPPPRPGHLYDGKHAGGVRVGVLDVCVCRVKVLGLG